MQYLFYLPSLVIFTLFFTNAAIQASLNAYKRRAAEAAKKAREEATAHAKAERDARKAAEKADRDAAEQAKPKRKRGRPRKHPDQAPKESAQTERAKTICATIAPFKGNNCFAGEIVAFAGELDGMTRAEAMKAVEDNGGIALDAMTESATILVVGKNPDTIQPSTTRERAGQVQRLTQREFCYRLSLPLTLTPDEFAAHFAPRKQ